MNTNENDDTDDGISVFAEAKALATAICLLRRAQGKSIPPDFEIGSEEWQESVKEFAADVLRLPPEDLRRLAPIAQMNPRPSIG